MPRSHRLRSEFSSLTAALLAATLPGAAEQRFLLAAENQRIEVNRAGRVTSVLKHPGHRNIWDAWRLPDGGIFYVHRDGLTVFDQHNRLILEHPAVRHGNDVEAPAAPFSTVAVTSPCSIAKPRKSASSTARAPSSAAPPSPTSAPSPRTPATA